MKIEPNSCSSPCVVKVLYHELLGSSVQLRGVQTDKQTRGFSVNSLNLTRGCSQVLFYFFIFWSFPMSLPLLLSNPLIAFLPQDDSLLPSCGKYTIALCPSSLRGSLSPFSWLPSFIHEPLAHPHTHTHTCPHTPTCTPHTLK